MQSLIRTSQGNFNIKDSYTLEEIKNNNYALLKIKDFLDYPIIDVDDELYFKIKNGVQLPNTYNIKTMVIFTYQNQEIAIYENKDNILKSYIQF